MGVLRSMPKSRRMRRLLSGAIAVACLSASMSALALGNSREASLCSGPQCLDGLSRHDANASAQSSEPRPWHFQRVLGSKTIEITVGFVACSRQSAPVIRPKVIERSERVVITTLVYPRSVPPGTRCLRLRGKRHLRVKLGAPVSHLKLFDGSYSPPKLRWPAE